MSLRYKGKPQLSANVQYDERPIDWPCVCKFRGVGFSLDNAGCKVHPNDTYPCRETRCHDYRPSKVKLSPNHWPRCVCGEIAEMH